MKSRPPGMRLNQSHCVYGHPYDGYVHADGKRRCRKCLQINRQRARLRRAALRAAEKERHL